METTKIKKGLFALTALVVLVIAGMAVVYAANNTGIGKHGFGLGFGKPYGSGNNRIGCNSTNQSGRWNQTAISLKMNQTQTAINNAIDAGDYNAWQSAVNGSAQGKYLMQKITASNFQQYVEMEKDLKNANDIAKELNLTSTRGFGFGPRGRQMPGKQ